MGAFFHFSAPFYVALFAALAPLATFSNLIIYANIVDKIPILYGKIKIIYLRQKLFSIRILHEKKGKGITMKRIFMIAVLFISLFSMASAISLDELRNNPSRYQHVFTGDISDEYIDNTSVKIVRTSPPYYIINAKAYAVYYNNNTITLYENTYYLNSERSLKRLHEIYHGNIAKGSDAWYNDSGVKWRPLGVAIYNFDGSKVLPYTAANPLDSIDIISAKPTSPAYMSGMYVFYKSYNEYFNGPINLF